MAAPEFEHIDSGVFTTLPTAHISGDDPAVERAQRSGDIVHTRNGQTISARSFASVKVWNLSLPKITQSELTNLRAYWDDRVFYLRPTGSTLFKFTVRWAGDFNPQYVGPGIFSLDIPLEETI